MIRPQHGFPTASSICIQEIRGSHLRALAALPHLTKLNLYHLRWAEDAVKLGLGWLAAQLPRLRILNAPSEVLVRHDVSQPMYSTSNVCPTSTFQH
jgi:hypothetical protein